MLIEYKTASLKVIREEIKQLLFQAIDSKIKSKSEIFTEKDGKNKISLLIKILSKNFNENSKSAANTKF